MITPSKPNPEGLTIRISGYGILFIVVALALGSSDHLKLAVLFFVILSAYETWAKNKKKEPLK
jgi:hypothetical protein